MSDAKQLEGKIFTRPVKILIPFIVILFILILKRLFFGLGSVTNLNGGYPWGLWISFDLLVGTGFACGGWALAWAVYIFNKGEYHSLVRPALLASLFGYALGGFSISMDVGRWWNLPYFFIPSHFNTGSVLFETATCMTAYIGILILEFMPAILEKMGWKSTLKVLNKMMFFIIALGALLPTMHQSSMGSLFIAAGNKIHPLWQSYELLPLFSVLTAFIMGFSIVIFEGSIVQASLHGEVPNESLLFYRLSHAVELFLFLFILIRFGEIIYHGKVHYLLNMDFYSLLFFLEIALIALPLVVFHFQKLRQDSRWLFTAAICVLLGGALWRIDLSLLAYNPGEGYKYFPSVQEILLSFGLIAIEITAYLIIVKILPVLPIISKLEESRINQNS